MPVQSCGAFWNGLTESPSGCLSAGCEPKKIPTHVVGRSFAARPHTHTLLHLTPPPCWPAWDSTLMTDAGLARQRHRGERVDGVRGEEYLMFQQIHSSLGQRSGNSPKSQSCGRVLTQSLPSRRIYSGFICRLNSRTAAVHKSRDPVGGSAALL